MGKCCGGALGQVLNPVAKNPGLALAAIATAVIAPELLPELATTGATTTAGMMSAAEYEASVAATQAALADAGFSTGATAAATTAAALPAVNALTEAGVPSVNTSTFMNSVLPGDFVPSSYAPLGSGLTGAGASVPGISTLGTTEGALIPGAAASTPLLGTPLDALGNPLAYTPALGDAGAAAAAASATQDLSNAFNPNPAPSIGPSGTLPSSTSLPNVPSSSSNSTNNYVVSGGTTGGSSSGPWNAPMSPGVATVGRAAFPTMANPLASVASKSIVPTYTPSDSMLNNIMGHQQQGEFSSATGYKKGGEVKADLSKFEPEFVDIIRKRTPDKSHPNYNGTPLFRTGGLGKHVQGPGTGQSDDIPAMLADGEYVFDADTVSALGDGSNKAGAEALDKMRERIRKHKRSAPIDKIPPKAKDPLHYLKGK